MNLLFPEFQKLINNRFRYKLFLLTQLPMGLISGLKIVSFTPQQSCIAVKFRWINKNPFRSIYFAVLSMAAELSTGILIFAQTYRRKPEVSMLITNMEAEFYKKATGRIIFECSDGNKVIQTIEQAIANNNSATIDCTSLGKNEEGLVVAKFIFTWSIKVHQQ